jgi:hypothetical protein
MRVCSNVRLEVEMIVDHDSSATQEEIIEKARERLKSDLSRCLGWRDVGGGEVVVTHAGV